jgi:hypothetical protein
VGGSLTRTAPNPGLLYVSGAASSQFITHGDAFVEFEATETNKTRLCGLSTVPFGNPPDTDPNFTSIGFALDVHGDGHIYLFEGGAQIVLGADPDTSYGTYAAGTKFRVKVKDNFDGTATIAYVKVLVPCAPGTACPETPIYTSGSVAYPLRVDSSLRDQGSTLTNVALVRIQ